MKKYAIAIHAGAETLDPKEMSPEKEAQYREGLTFQHQGRMGDSPII